MKKLYKHFQTAMLVLSVTMASLPQGITVKADNNNIYYNDIKDIAIEDMTEEQLKIKNEYDKSIEAGYANSYQDIGEEPPMSVSEYEDYIPVNYSYATRQSYDPRTDTDITIPDIRNQGELGTCWAHSAMCLVEMNLAKQGYNIKDDMSEFQTVYFMNHDWTDPLGLCTNDNFHNIQGSSTALSPDWYKEGGNTAYTKFLLMDWVGSVSEKRYTETAYNVLETKKAAASLDDSYAISKDEAHIQDVTVINTSDKDVVKGMVSEYGAVGIAYYHANNEEGFYQNACYYNNKYRTTNHAVAIVGWDDNYSKDKFKVAPPGNGAWLVRNSWGGYWGDKGYFWLSYYDTSLASDGYVIQAYTPDDTDNYYMYNYQYDGGIATNYIYYDGVSEISEANIFKAQGDEVLRAVSFYTKADYDYTVDIYKDITDGSKPDSGTKVPGASVSGRQDFEGYHTVQLANSVNLKDGDEFSVVVTLSARSTDTAYIPLDCTFNSGSKYSYAEALEGQSFFRPSASDTWTDAAKSNGANIRIKAYTINAAKNPVTNISFGESSIDLNVSDTYDLNNIITVLPENTDDKIVFSSDNETVAIVDNSGIITAKRPGKAVIKAAARAGTGKAEITVNVPLSVPAESIQLSQETLKLAKGTSKKIDAVILPANTDDYAIWSSSDVSVASVDTEGNVTGNGEGMALIKAETISGKSAICQVTVENRDSGEEIRCTFDKLPKKIYKYNTYIVSLNQAMARLSPVSITWESSSQNIEVKPVGTDGKDGCELYVKNVTSNRNRGEKVVIKATATYIKTTKNKTLTKTKLFKRAATAINLSYEVSLDKPVIYITEKGATETLVATLNEGRADDQPTNTKLKWMVTDINGNRDKKGGRVVSVNGKGIVKAKGPGTTYVTVCAADSYIKKEKKYTVIATAQITCRPVTSVGFDVVSVKVPKDGTADLKQKLVFNNGNTEPYNKDGMKLAWSSSDRRYVKVNGKGIIKVAKKAPEGTYTITVKATGGVPKGETVPEGTIQVVVS